MDATTGPSSPDAAPPPGRFGLGAIREACESVSLTDQFRIAAIAAVTVTLLVVQLVSALWDTRVARDEALQLAHTKVDSMAERLQGAGGGALDNLEGHVPIMLSTFRLGSGQLLQRYVRSDLDPATGPEALRWTTAPTGAWHWIKGYLALEPLYVERAIDLGGGLDGTVSIVVDNHWIWDHAWRRLAQAPVAVLFGCLIALFAANSLKRRVVEPLAQLAETTRVKDWTQPEQAQSVRQRRNELMALATNFDALADRLAEYERDLTTVRHASSQQIIERTRELESRLRKAEALTRSKDEFLASMSHEIRTPMNGVLGMAELLAGTNLDKRQRRFVDSMRAAAETMMQIINDILDDSKIEAGKMDLVLEPFDIRELAEQAGQLYAGRAESKKLEMICRVEPTVPSIVLGDALRLRQVLGNLLSNAVKYTERGEVEIRIGLDDQRDGQCRLHFSVRDTGPGIAEHDQTGVFEAFTQLGATSRNGGTGLGLSIANRLVRLMGGNKIDLTSELNRGSNFSFVLPFEVREAAPRPDASSDEFQGLRVLVVDDNPTSYMLIEEMLSNWSADVTVLNHARPVVDRMHDVAKRGKPFHVVLLDHNLPDATTGELLRAIRLDPAIAGTYVALLSALDFNPSYEGTRAIEPDVCLAKPVRSQLLKGVLQASRQPRREQADRPAGVEAEEPVVERPDLPSLGLDVLVVDDNAINREVAVAMLEDLSCRVAVAANGSEAVARAGERRFDAILMDCQMPEMDGYQATETIRGEERRRGTAPVMIIALTANVLARDRDRCLAAGMNSFLAKPFKAAELYAALQPVIEAREASGGAAATVAAGATPAPSTVAAQDSSPNVALAPGAPPTRLADEDPAAAAASEAATTAAVTPAPADVQGEAAITEPASAAIPAGQEAPPLEGTEVDAMLTGSPTQEADAANSSTLGGVPPPATTSSTGRLPVLDLEQVQSIRGLGKPAVFERLCDMLFTSAKDGFARLDAALAAGDLDEIGTAAHSLKSPVSNLGGRRLADLLERCEIAALESRDLAVVRRSALGLKAHYAALVAALESETRRSTGTG
jgi:signal transduction histidine kinase/CheY-like chemotaxis protein/HPt (histidine-containing phosphotransfer) domain-containing protein